MSQKISNVVFNHDIDRDDIRGVVSALREYISSGQGHAKNVLICWEHKQLNDIAAAIIESSEIGDAGNGVNVAEYPKDRLGLSTRIRVLSGS